MPVAPASGCTKNSSGRLVVSNTTWVSWPVSKQSMLCQTAVQVSESARSRTAFTRVTSGGGGGSTATGPAPVMKPNESVLAGSWVRTDTRYAVFGFSVGAYPNGGPWDGDCTGTPLMVIPASKPPSVPFTKMCALVGTSVCPSAGYDQMILGSGRTQDAWAGAPMASAGRQTATNAHDCDAPSPLMPRKDGMSSPRMAPETPRKRRFA